MNAHHVPLERIDSHRWRIPRHGGMNVDGLVFASDAMMQTIRGDQSLQQVVNVAHLPGIVGHSIAMPDIHWGYGFPIGGVAAFDVRDGVISPGGIGYDINCGVRLLGSGLSRQDVQGRMREVAEGLFRNIPSGVGARQQAVRLSHADLQGVLKRGAGWAVSQGYGASRDLEHTEENGCLAEAEPQYVSQRALERGRPQLGSIGSGNHFVEVDYVAEVYDEQVAGALGLFKDQLAITIHTGSRGLGYQVCDDFVKTMQRAAQQYGIAIPDRQLCCAPLNSPPAREYIGAMYSAANFAFANRQLITHTVRRDLCRGAATLGAGPADRGDLRRVPQHRQVRDRIPLTGRRAACACIAKAPPAPWRRGIHSCRRCIAIWASQCSFRATWADTPTC